MQDFCLVKLINDQSYIDSVKFAPQPLPDFDEDNFPFLLFGGAHTLAIMNVKTGEHKPLMMTRSVAVCGMSCYFVKRENYGLSIHWTTHAPKVEGSCQEGLIEYSYMAFK